MGKDVLSRDEQRHYTRIAALKGDPGWAELEEALTIADMKAWNRFTAELKTGSSFDPETLAELRGTSKAIRLILEAPDKAARIIARENERKDSE